MDRKWIVPVSLVVGGIVFYNAVAPLLESLTNMAQQAMNCKIGKWQFDMEERQAEHEATVELIKPNDSNMTHAIGFQIPSDDSEEDDYYV